MDNFLGSTRDAALKYPFWLFDFDKFIGEYVSVVVVWHPCMVIHHFVFSFVTYMYRRS